MLGNSTPFKIHDENGDMGGGVSAMKSNKKGLGGGGLGGGEGGIMSVKKVKSIGLGGLGGRGDITKTPLASKSVRKALGDLSTSHVNTQQRGQGGATTGGKAAAAKTSGLTKSTNKVLSFKVASDDDATTLANEPSTSSSTSASTSARISLSSGIVDDNDMICSHVSKDADIYDIVRMKASKMTVLLAPSGATSTATSAGEDENESVEVEEEQDWNGIFAVGDYMADDDFEQAYGYDGAEGEGFTLPAEEPFNDE